MARRAPKNPINDIKDAVGAWLGGNRGSMPSSGAGAAWQASARSAAQSGNQRIVKGLEEGVVQFGALGMGTSAQAQRDLMYGVPGAGTQAAKEASVSYVTGAAVGYGVGKVAGKAASKVVESGVPARVANRLTGQTVIIHGTNVQGLKGAGQKLMPNVPPARPEVGKVLFGITPSPTYGPEEVSRIAQHYAAQRSTWTPTNKTFSGSVYVAKVPTKALKSQGVTFRQSTSPGKIVSEIPVSGSSPNPSKDFVERLEKAYKRAGGKFPKASKEKKYKAPKNQPLVRS